AALADIGIADVAEMRNLAARADRRVLGLHKCADLAVSAQVGARAQVGEGTDGCARPDHRVGRVGAGHPRTLAHLNGFEGRVGADYRARLDARGARELGSGENLDVFGEDDVAVDPGRVGV